MYLRMLCKTVLLSLAVAHLTAEDLQAANDYVTSTGDACNDLCSLIPKCGYKGSYCKGQGLCQDLYWNKTEGSNNATACTVWLDPHCVNAFPVRCEDISTFDTPPRFPITATATIEGHGSGKWATGKVTFEQYDYQKTKISYSLKWLHPWTEYEISIHETSTFNPDGCKSTGEGYNPFYNPHGGRTDTPRQVGDMGNFTSNILGRSSLEFYSDIIVLHGPLSVLNRSVVLTVLSDDTSNDEIAVGVNGDETPDEIELRCAEGTTVRDEFACLAYLDRRED
ncbi:Superoxide dismutase [Cu-Zn] [Perkinsus chesapeaki]|uniref:Superoxide dismutase [Cu-Zn] n=1 Tax=Perkinsus chesapeaki TaxID=330153 RepID=A0A7J6LS66_PERCH|nr:Superoxide dismutase [Cu-Zn] [Perkinsus chesapeaki]